MLHQQQRLPDTHVDCHTNLHLSCVKNYCKCHSTLQNSLCSSEVDDQLLSYANGSSLPRPKLMNSFLPFTLISLCPGSPCWFQFCKRAPRYHSQLRASIPSVLHAGSGLLALSWYLQCNRQNTQELLNHIHSDKKELSGRTLSIPV